MNKVYLGKYCGLHYYMADKVYRNLDWWEATALAEQLGGELPTTIEFQVFSKEIITHIGDGWDKYNLWNWWSTEPDTASVTLLDMCEKNLRSYPSLGSNYNVTPKRSKASAIIIFKEKREVGIQSQTHAKHFLKKALEVQDSRASEYDTDKEEERNMGKIVTAFNAITGHTLTEAEGYLFMECLKNVRLFNAPHFHEDSAVDGVSYSSLKAEAKAKEYS